MKVLVTGAAGFIGMHVCQRLLARGDEVIGIDNLNDYYDVQLKQARLARLQQSDNFRFAQTDVADASALSKVFQSQRFDVVVHLAAMPGLVRSWTDFDLYNSCNLMATLYWPTTASGANAPNT